MPIERTTNLQMLSTALLVTAAGSTRIITGTTARQVEIHGYWLNSASANTVTFIGIGDVVTGGGLSGFLFPADRGGSVNCNPTGAYDANGRLVPWFATTQTSSHVFLNLLNATSVSGCVLYTYGS